MADPPLYGGLVSPKVGPGAETAPMRPTLTSKPHQEAQHTYYLPRFGFTSCCSGVVPPFRWMHLDIVPTIFRTHHSLQLLSLQVNPGPFHGSLHQAGLIPSAACRFRGAAPLRVKFCPSDRGEALAVH